LAVSIELVSEEVSEEKRAWPRPLDRLRKCRLVHFEEPELRPVRREEGGSDPRHEVGPGPVPGELVALPEDPRCDGGRRRLPVGRRDESDALTESSCECVDGAWIELPQHLARKRRSTAAS